MKWKIPLFKIYWDEEDVRLVSEVIRRGMYWAIGPEIEEFENLISEYIGVKYCTVFNSGTSALHAALLAHEVGEGDEVIVPSFTFIATANAPLFVGAKPIFADIEEETFGLDPEDVKEKITKKTKAIIPVHYAGCPCFIKELKEIAEDFNLILIEDAAEAFGAKVKEKKVGTFGNSAMFSFCANKVITTGEGGAIVTNSKNLYEKLKLIRSHGRVDKGNYFSSTEKMDYISLGYNLRMSNITASLGIAQLKKIDKIIEMRRKNVEYMSKELSKIKGIVIPEVHKDFFHVYQMYTIKVNEGKEKRNELMNYLKSKGIMTKIYFSPIHLTEFYRKKFGYKEGELPATEKISKEVLTLPMYPLLKKNEMDYITREINEFPENE